MGAGGRSADAEHLDVVVGGEVLLDRCMGLFGGGEEHRCTVCGGGGAGGERIWEVDTGCDQHGGSVQHLRDLHGCFESRRPGDALRVVAGGCQCSLDRGSQRILSPGRCTVPPAAEMRWITARTRASSPPGGFSRIGAPASAASGVPVNASAKSVERASTTAFAVTLLSCREEEGPWRSSPAFASSAFAAAKVAFEISIAVSIRSAPEARNTLSSSQANARWMVCSMPAAHGVGRLDAQRGVGVRPR
jgi:hypothetical protein